MEYTRILSTVILLAVAGSATAEMRELQNETLDAVTAGTTDTDPTRYDHHAAGGTIVANGSAATVNESNEVSLEDTAQESAQGVNIVNASNALVAQGLNIWDGQFQSGGLAIEPVVEQSNLVMQSETSRSASLQGYQRDLSSMENSTLITTANNTDTIDLISDVMVDTSQTVIGQNLNVGLGVGLAGRVGIDLGPAVVGIGLTAESSIMANMDVTGEVDLPWPLGSMNVDGNMNMTMTNSGSFEVDVSTPAITIDAVGAVCYTKLGDCTAHADDHSTYQTNTTHDETHSLDTQGALSVDEIQAEYVVIDESTLEIVSGNSLRLASGAQANLAAVNAVNAVGSMVANGLNVARTTFDGAEVAMPLDLSQRNVVIQGM